MMQFGVMDYWCPGCQDYVIARPMAARCPECGSNLVLSHHGPKDYPIRSLTLSKGAGEPGLPGISSTPNPPRSMKKEHAAEVARLVEDIDWLETLKGAMAGVLASLGTNPSLPGISPQTGSDDWLAVSDYPGTENPLFEALHSLDRSTSDLPAGLEQPMREFAIKWLREFSGLAEQLLQERNQKLEEL